MKKKRRRMIVKDFYEILKSNPNNKMHWMLPDNSFVPQHYHITEVGKVQKDFIDCGGTVRSKKTCLIQIWVANDTDHRLETNKLASILEMAMDLVGSNLEIEVEYEDQVISQYPLSNVEMTPSGILFYLGKNHTACLAPEKCGLKGCC
jgi:hypothetical protein